MTRPSRRAFLLATGSALALTGCSGLDVLNAVTPDEGVRVAADIAYGPDPRQRLDIYAPEAQAAADSVPMLLFFYGGSWRWGSRTDYRFVGATFARAGIVTAIADYRLYPQTRFPGFVEDGAAAASWLLREGAAHGGDPSRLVIGGHSAGAHIAAMVATRREFLATNGHEPADLAGLLGLAGPYAFDPFAYRRIAPIFEGSDRIAANPARAVEAAPRRTLLLHGADDGTVAPINTEEMADALKSRGAAVEADILPGLGHAGLVAAIAPTLRGEARVFERMLDFLRTA